MKRLIGMIVVGAVVLLAGSSSCSPVNEYDILDIDAETRPTGVSFGVIQKL